MHDNQRGSERHSSSQCQYAGSRRRRSRRPAPSASTHAYLAGPGQSRRHRVMSALRAPPSLEPLSVTRSMTRMREQSCGGAVARPVRVGTVPMAVPFGVRSSRCVPPSGAVNSTEDRRVSLGTAASCRRGRVPRTSRRPPSVRVRARGERARCEEEG